MDYHINQMDRNLTQARIADKSWWQVFLEALAEWPNVSRAARTAGVTRQTAYNHRDEFEDFAAAWDNALETGLDRWEEEAARRAFEGVNKPVIYQGEITDTYLEYSDTLAITMLKAHRPDKYRERSEVKSDVDLNIRIKFDE